MKDDGRIIKARGSSFHPPAFILHPWFYARVKKAAPGKSGFEWSW